MNLFNICAGYFGFPRFSGGSTMYRKDRTRNPRDRSRATNLQSARRVQLLRRASWLEGISIANAATMEITPLFRDSNIAHSARLESLRTFALLWSLILSLSSPIVMKADTVFEGGENG